MLLAVCVVALALQKRVSVHHPTSVISPVHPLLFDLPQIIPETAVKGPGDTVARGDVGLEEPVDGVMDTQGKLWHWDIVPGHWQVWLTAAFLRG